MHPETDEQVDPDVIRERLLLSLSNLYPEDRVINRFNHQPGDGSGYIMESLNFSLYLADTAWQAAERYATSYRGFYVGVAALAASVDFDRIALLHGVNHKIDEAGSVNEHAEDLIISKARRLGFHILTLVVVGNTQEDHGSGLLTNTLHPCGRCRPMLQAAPEISDRTTFFSALPDRSHFEMYDLNALMKLHTNGSADDLDAAGVVSFETPDLDQWHEVTSPILARRAEEIFELAA